MRKIVVINNTDLEDGDALALVSSVAEMVYKSNPTIMGDYQVFEFTRNDFMEYVLSGRKNNLYLGIDKSTHRLE